MTLRDSCICSCRRVGAQTELYLSMSDSESHELAELITLEQAAERLTVCRRTLEREIARGRFPKPVRIGRATRVAVSDLRAYIESLKSGVIAYPVQ